jgi:hypothetical protein
MLFKLSRPAAEVMKILFGCHSTQFEAVLVQKFIECLDIYLIGLLVEFRTEEDANVKDPNKNSRLKPRVSAVLDEDKKSHSPLIVDASSESSDMADRTIKRVLYENKIPADPLAFLDLREITVAKRS